jgi:hypothetical protein
MKPNWVHGAARPYELREEHGVALRRIENAAYGLRWLEIAHEWRCELNASLARQVPLGWLESTAVYDTEDQHPC